MPCMCASIDVSHAVHRANRLTVSNDVQRCGMLLQSVQSRQFGVSATSLLQNVCCYGGPTARYTKKSTTTVTTRILRMMMTTPTVVIVELHHVVNVIPLGTKYSNSRIQTRISIWKKRSRKRARPGKRGHAAAQGLRPEGQTGMALPGRPWGCQTAHLRHHQ